MGKHKGDIGIGHRMVEELLRIYGNKACAERRFGCRRTAIWEWENGVTPGGFVLAKLHYVGGDVLYVLTGKRGA